MFYHYMQNNSGGSFIQGDDVGENVWIEADSAEEADKRAELVGIYFDGCYNDLDCPCCGDRWDRVWGDGDTTVSLYGETITFKEGDKSRTFNRDGDQHVYFKGGKHLHIKSLGGVISKILTLKHSHF